MPCWYRPTLVVSLRFDGRKTKRAKICICDVCGMFHCINLAMTCSTGWFTSLSTQLFNGTFICFLSTKERKIFICRSTTLPIGGYKGVTTFSIGLRSRSNIQCFAAHLLSLKYYFTKKLGFRHFPFFPMCADVAGMEI